MANTYATMPDPATWRGPWDRTDRVTVAIKLRRAAQRAGDIEPLIDHAWAAARRDDYELCDAILDQLELLTGRPRNSF